MSGKYIILFLWVVSITTTLGTDQVDANDVTEGEIIKLICEFEPGFKIENLDIIWEYPNMEFIKENNNLRINYTTEFVNLSIISTLILWNAHQINNEGTFICKLRFDDAILTEKYFNIKFEKSEQETVTIQTFDITIIILIVIASVIFGSILVNILLWGFYKCYEMLTSRPSQNENAMETGTLMEGNQENIQ